MAPNFRIDQAGGGGTGTMNKSRPYGLWEGLDIELYTPDAGPYAWVIESAPPGSSAALVDADQATCTLTPDVTNYPWRIRLTTGTGSTAQTRVFIVAVNKDNAGADINRGWVYPAYLENIGEDTSDESDGRGYAARMELILEDIRAELGAGGALLGDVTGPSGSNTVERIQNIPVDVDGDNPPEGMALIIEPTGLGARIRGRSRSVSNIFWDEGNTSAVPPLYGVWADALDAAQTLAFLTGGPVNLWVLNANDPPTIPSGTSALNRAIRLKGCGSAAPLVEKPIVVTLASGAVLQDAVCFEDLIFSGDLTAEVLTSTGGPLDVEFVRCGHADGGNAAPFADLATGTNRFVFRGNSSFLFDTAPFATLSSGKNVDVFVEGFSTLNAEAFGGTAGTLTVYVDGGSVVESQGSFSGTLTRHDSSTRAWRAQGVAGTQKTDGTAWVTVGAVYLDPSILASPPTSTREYRLHADLEVVEASPNSVTAELRLVDSSLTVVGSVASTLGGASSYPQHRSSSPLTAGGSNGQVRPTATTYLVQLRRQGGSAGDFAICHSTHVEATWS